MNAAEYKAMQDRVELLSRLLLDTDPEELNRFVVAAERADSLGPLLDPTAWMRGHETLAMVRDHARTLARARNEIERAAERAGALQR